MIYIISVLWICTKSVWFNARNIFIWIFWTFLLIPMVVHKRILAEGGFFRKSMKSTLILFWFWVWNSLWNVRHRQDPNAFVFKSQFKHETFFTSIALCQGYFIFMGSSLQGLHSMLFRFLSYFGGLGETSVQFLDNLAKRKVKENFCGDSLSKSFTGYFCSILVLDFLA